MNPERRRKQHIEVGGVSGRRRRRRGRGFPQFYGRELGFYEGSRLRFNRSYGERSTRLCFCVAVRHRHHSASSYFSLPRASTDLARISSPVSAYKAADGMTSDIP